MAVKHAFRSLAHAAPPLCTGLPPITGARPHTLILGSMPGARSLAMQQYYAHPQNAFWRIMGELFAEPVETYPQRRAVIENNRLALWDTLYCCARTGSLDSGIEDSSIEVNDFAAFFRRYGGIRRVFFNGGRAEAEFRKRVLPSLPPEIGETLCLHRLPSTSPAHAGRSFREKLGAWRDVAALKDQFSRNG